jgi:serine protease Do
MATATNPMQLASISVGNELAQVAQRLGQVTMQVFGSESGWGAGVLWSSDGIVVTNAHVVSARRCKARLPDGRIVEAELVNRDLRRDLAALRINAAGSLPAQVRDASTMRTGELVLALGNPFGIQSALTIGVLAERRAAGDLLLRADIRLAPGNSGGPLADAEGRVIGINSMVVNGSGIAISTEAVTNFLSTERTRTRM